MGSWHPPKFPQKSHPQKWRPFCLRFEGVVEDFNYGTLLRLDCSKGYTEENTIFGESQNLLIHLFLTPNPTRTPCRALRGGNGVGRGEAAPPRPAPSPPDLLRAPFFFSFPSHQNPVFCHRNSSEPRGLQQRRLQQRQGASEGVRTNSAPLRSPWGQPRGCCPPFFFPPWDRGRRRQDSAGRPVPPAAVPRSSASACNK